MKFNQVHDKLLPWRIARVRKAALAPLETASTWFRTFLGTWWECFAPQSPHEKGKK